MEKKSCIPQTCLYQTDTQVIYDFSDAYNSPHIRKYIKRHVMLPVLIKVILNICAFLSSQYSK